ncbi:MAG TPA: epoxyqueuosine reductase [Spirochaetes bacterium]|nr:epoxyqueuosine reductase [Spirochaetota bacterium]
MKKIKPDIIKDIIGSNIEGIDAVTVVPVIPLGDAARKVIESIEKGFVPESYHWTREKTEHAYRYKNYSAWARSVIVAAISYYTDEKYPKDQLTGRIARFTWRNNYRYLSLKLEKAVKALGKTLGVKIKSKSLSNYTSLPEKALFNYSGIARFGKNSVLLNRDMGSYFVIGEALTDLEVEFDRIDPLKPPDFSPCGECERCLRACPTGAIVQAGEIDIKRCFQYISENLILMPVSYREKWGNRLYGCSECIDVCPFNRNLDPRAPKHNTGYVGQGVNLIEILKMGAEQWERLFHENQVGIRDKNAILKNAITSLGYLGYRKSLKYLLSFLEHENKIIRAYTAWAIGKINTKTGKKRLISRYKDETVDSVRTEIEPFL